MKYQKRIHWDEHRPEFLKIGFVIALAITFTAFNYTTTPPVIEPYAVGPEIEDEMLPPPVTVQKKKVPLPPPKPKDILEFEMEVEQEPVVEFEQEVEIDDAIETTFDEFVSDALPEVAPIVEPVIEDEPEEELPLVLAERMPIYGSCDVDSEENARRDCTSQNLIKHIYKNVKYPTMAMDYEMQGTVVVSFVVNKQGDVEDVRILRDIGMGCGEEVMRVINALDRFLPGRQNGRPVSVIYRLPVKFSLQ